MSCFHFEKQSTCSVCLVMYHIELFVLKVKFSSQNTKVQIIFEIMTAGNHKLYTETQTLGAFLKWQFLLFSLETKLIMRWNVEPISKD